MKVYSTKYFEWTVLLLIDLFAIGTLAYVVHIGLTYDKKYSMDFGGYSLVLIGVLVLGAFLWDTIVLFDFIIKDVNGLVTIDKDRLKITKGRKEEVYDIKDLLTIEFSERIDGSRSMTASLTYCKLTFKNKVIFLTSFTIYNHELTKYLGQQVSKAISRERRFFELIK